MKKLIAGFMTALMALTQLAVAAELGNYPAFLEDADGTLDALVVIGSDAKVADVVGAVDLAVRLAEVGETAVSTACSGASAAVEGTRKDTVPLSGDLSVIFPSSGVLKSAHYSGLLDTVVSWRGNDYDYREQVDFGSVAMSHDLATSNVNGTEKMIVQSGDVKYQLVFEKALNLSSASGIGTIASPEYTYPINIEMLGKEFAIVGISGSQVKMLHGSIGTATATTPVVYGDYSIYADLGADGSWTRVIFKDADGNTVDTLTINQGDSKQSTATGLTAQVTAVRALQDGTVVGADVVVGPTSEGVTKTYDVTADVTSTGTSSDRFPSETEWGIQVKGGTFATSGEISVGDTLEVIYKPSTTQYLVAGGMISLPNEYGNLEFEGWSTNKFATITIRPLSGTVSAYNASADTQAFGNLQGLEILADVSGSIVSRTNTGYDKAYVLFNYSRTGEQVPVFIGFYDSAKQKILVSGTIVDKDADDPGGEMPAKIIDYAGTYTGSANHSVSYPFKLVYGNAGDTEFYLNVTAAAGDVLLLTTGAGTSATSPTLSFAFLNKSAPKTTQAPEFKLGGTAASTEVSEINATTHGTAANAGKKTQEVVDDSGILLQSTDVSGASDQVVFKIPFKALNASVYFGTKGEGVTGDAVSYTNYPSIPINAAIAKLDTEVTASNKDSNLILVGGPCVNDLAQELVDAEKLDEEYTCAGGLGAKWVSDKAYIVAVEDAFTTGKVALLVAGTQAKDTRAAASALQLFDTKLDGVTASAVEVTGTVGAPTVTPV